MTAYDFACYCFGVSIFLVGFVHSLVVIFTAIKSHKKTKNDLQREPIDLMNQKLQELRQGRFGAQLMPPKFINEKKLLQFKTRARINKH